MAKQIKKTFKGKKPYRKPNGKPSTKTEEKVEGEVVDKRGYNDPMWYAKNPQMLADAASYSYNNPLGNPVPSVYSEIANTHYIPGLMVNYLAPTIGRSDGPASPANIAAINCYSYVRYKNSGAANYDAPDLMMYYLAMDNIYSMWNWMKRIYGYASVYSQYNRYLPASLAVADHVDIADIAANLADFRWMLNRSAAQISAFCVPGTMSYFLRHSWLYSNVYKDSDTRKAQLYMFSPDGFYKYNETGSKFGTQLVYNRITTTLTYQALVTMMTQYLAPLQSSEDIGIMSGDILKAYGEGNLFKLTPVDPEYNVMPVYVEEVLNQIHNSTCVPYDTTDVASMNVTQDPDTGYITWNPVMNKPIYTRTGFLVNMPWDEVTPANTMVGTRLCASAFVNGANKGSIHVCGSEIVVRRSIVINNGTTAPTVMNITSDVISYAADPSNNNMRLAIAVSNFDWHPLLHVVVSTGNLSNGYLGDISNYTVIDVNSMDQMHSTAVMSEFNIPEIGSF